MPEIPIKNRVEDTEELTAKMRSSAEQALHNILLSQFAKDLIKANAKTGDINPLKNEAELEKAVMKAREDASASVSRGSNHPVQKIEYQNSEGGPRTTVFVYGTSFVEDNIRTDGTVIIKKIDHNGDGIDDYAHLESHSIAPAKDAPYGKLLYTEKHCNYLYNYTLPQPDGCYEVVKDKDGNVISEHGDEIHEYHLRQLQLKQPPPIK